MTGKENLKLGLIGCGAIAQFAYLPASRHLEGATIVGLADKNISRARMLGQQYGITNCVDDYRQLLGQVDGVVLALPHDLHAPVATEFLTAKTAVLVEKPLALTTSEAEQVVELARTNETLLQVGQIYRFCHRAQMIKRAIEQGWLGNLKTFSLEGNFADTNPMASGFAWDKKRSGGGTLMDVGSLILDLLMWWFGEPVRLEYRDDAAGGVECECEVDVEFKNARGSISGKVILSRLRKLRDIVRIDGDKLSIVYGFETNQGLLELIPADRDWQIPFLVDARSLPFQNHIDFFTEQLKNFSGAIRAPEKSAAPAKSVLPSLAMVEECYRIRQPLTFPWEVDRAQVVQYAA